MEWYFAQKLRYSAQVGGLIRSLFTKARGRLKNKRPLSNNGWATVCFLDKWPHTKYKVTFNTSLFIPGFFWPFEKKLKAKKTQNSRKKLKLKLITQIFGIF